MGLALQRGLKTAIDEQAGRRRGGRDDGQDAAGELSELRRAKVFFAKLDQVEAAMCPESGLPAKGGLSLGLVAGKEGSVGDGAAEHVD